MTIDGTLDLSDGNSTHGGAQYIKVLLGASIDGDIVKNIHGQTVRIHPYQPREGTGRLLIMNNNAYNWNK